MKKRDTIRMSARSFIRLRSRGYDYIFLRQALTTQLSRTREKSKIEKNKLALNDEEKDQDCQGPIETQERYYSKQLIKKSTCADSSCFNYSQKLQHAEIFFLFLQDQAFHSLCLFSPDVDVQLSHQRSGGRPGSPKTSGFPLFAIFASRLSSILLSSSLDSVLWHLGSRSRCERLRREFYLRRVLPTIEAPHFSCCQ